MYVCMYIYIYIHLVDSSRVGPVTIARGLAMVLRCEMA